MADWKTKSKLNQSSHPTNRCSGRASRPKIVRILEKDFVSTVISLLIARR